eukprot:COSAG02_NODE_125_length_34972_cov_101.069997_4_plen_86_part_00
MDLFYVVPVHVDLSGHVHVQRRARARAATDHACSARAQPTTRNIFETPPLRHVGALQVTKPNGPRCPGARGVNLRQLWPPTKKNV